MDENGVAHYSNDPPARPVAVETRKEIKRKPKREGPKENETSNDKTLKRPGKVNPEKVAFYERYVKITKKQLALYQKELAEIESETNGNHKDYLDKLERKKKQVFGEVMRLRMYTGACERAKKGL